MQGYRFCGIVMGVVVSGGVVVAMNVPMPPVSPGSGTMTLVSVVNPQQSIVQIPVQFPPVPPSLQPPTVQPVVPNASVMQIVAPRAPEFSRTRKNILACLAIPCMCCCGCCVLGELFRSCWDKIAHR
jgi:hypothetical protein